MANPVVHFEVVGKDLDRLTSFYSQLFEWKTQSIPDVGYTLVEKEEQGIAGGIGRDQNGGGGHVTFYVMTPDPQATLDRAVELGGRVIMPVTELPQVTIAQFADPEGHVVGITKGM